MTKRKMPPPLNRYGEMCSRFSRSVTGRQNPEKSDTEFDAASKFGVPGQWREDVACERYKGMKAQV